MNRLSKFSGGLLLLVFVLAACGGGGDDDNQTESDITTDATPVIEVINDPTATVVDNANIPAVEASPEPTLAPTDSPPTVMPTEVPVEDAGLPVDENGVEILARVNGVSITRTEFDLEYERRRVASSVADPNALAITVMDTLIEQVIIQQAAASLGLSVTPEEIEAELAENRALVGGDAAWQEWLSLNGYTAAEYRDTILPNSMLTFRIIDAVTDVPETVPQVNARHILVNTEPEAQGVLERLQAGEDFATLAAQYSNDLTTRDLGGDLGWFIPETLTTPELAEVALQLQPGQVAGPITTQLGYHIIQTLDIGERPPTPEEVALLIESQFRRWLATQLEEAEIERYLY